MFRIANAPCSWGVIERTEESARTLDYGQMLGEMQQTGYTGTELGDYGFMPTEPAQLKQILDKRNLALVAAWVTSVLIDPAEHEASTQRAVQTARLLSAIGGEESLIVVGDNLFAEPRRNQVVGRVRAEDSMASDQWQIFVRGLHTLARQVHDETGIRTVFHHHSATWIEAPFEVEKLLDLTDPALIGLCFDTGHYVFGGGTPSEAIQLYGDRIWHVHFKDCDPGIAAQTRAQGWDYNFAVGKGLFCELGEGEVDFVAVIDALKEVSYRGWIVIEQDVLPGLGTPKEAASRNRRYLRRLGL